jgi:tetratricopeptide (TPR) repeat protein
MIEIRRQQAQGDYAATVDPLREIVVERPDDAEANLLYGRALLATGQAAIATWSLRQAMRDPEWLVPAGLQLAQASLATSDFNEVVDVTSHILREHPDHAVALLYRAQAHAHWKLSPASALEDADRVLELDPDMLEAYEPRILALLALDRHPEATESLAEVGRRLAASDAAASSLAWHCSTTAVFAHEGGDTERARQTWGECVEAHPTAPTVVVNAVSFYDAHQEWSRSLEILRAAHERAPDHRGFRVGLADRLRRMGQSGEGEALLREAANVEDGQLAAVAWADLASYRHALGEHAAAADALARAIEHLEQAGEDPGPQLRFQYADALVVSGKLDRALAVAEEISVPAHQRLIRGRVAQERGDTVRALAEFDAALQVWPDNPWARYYAALAAEQLGDFDRALEEYRYSIRISVGATDARFRAARMLIAENRPTLAYQLLFLEVQKAPLGPEGELLSMYLMARVANPKQLQSALVDLASRDRALLPAALVSAADGASEAAGPGAALGLLVGAPGIDYTHPRSVPVLRAIVRFAHQNGQAELARRVVDAALSAHPVAPAFHSLRGLDLELGRGEPTQVREAYGSATELDPRDPQALMGLGRSSLPVDAAAALGFFERALAAAHQDPAAMLGAARAQRALGNADAAGQLLTELLVEHPLDTEAAAEAVSLDLSRGVATAITVDRARRTVRFGGGVEALDLLSQVHDLRNEPELAAQASERAKAIREAQAGEG